MQDLRDLARERESLTVVVSSEMGNINDFSSYKNLIAFAGIDPNIHQSGKFEGKSTISKRGNRHLRRVIFLMAKHVSRDNPFLRTYYLTQKLQLPSNKD